jgi:hypothetical protein
LVSSEVASAYLAFVSNCHIYRHPRADSASSEVLAVMCFASVSMCHDGYCLRADSSSELAAVRYFFLAWGGHSHRPAIFYSMAVSALSSHSHRRCGHASFFVLAVRIRRRPTICGGNDAFVSRYHNRRPTTCRGDDFFVFYHHSGRPSRAGDARGGDISDGAGDTCHLHRPSLEVRPNKASEEPYRLSTEGTSASACNCGRTSGDNK